MMLNVTTAAVALIASSLSAAGAPEASASGSAIPPMIVTVMAAGDISPRLVAAVLAEADAIWRPGGVSFNWRRAPQLALSAQAAESAQYLPNTLRLTIGDNRGIGHDGRLPLGWIVFDDVALPEQEIYLSHTNAKAMMDSASGVVGIVDQMPLSQRETLLARAMGRALAHELGHYLLASKVHTSRGLMKAVLTAVELFSPDSSPFHIEPAQRRSVAARLRGEPLVASR
jgi:hypothetical protein